MELRWGRSTKIGRQRIVQLINKTNQFNLTTRRYTDEEVATVIADPVCCRSSFACSIASATMASSRS